jgi:8-oxo-dGTP diphosphatase
MLEGTNPNISVDCVIFGFDFKTLNVLLLERKLIDEKSYPLISDYSLVGQHIQTNESLDEAAARILFETTGLKNIYLEQFYSFGSPKRLIDEKSQLWLKFIGLNPLGRIITIGYFSLVNKKAIHITNTERHATWFDIKEIGKLAFDHNHILKKALEALRLKIKSEPIAFELLPRKFTLSQLQKLYEVILDIQIDKRNFRKKALQSDYIVALTEKQKEISRKPAQLFMFSRDVYDATKKEDFSFNFK